MSLGGSLLGSAIAVSVLLTGSLGLLASAALVSSQGAATWFDALTPEEVRHVAFAAARSMGGAELFAPDRLEGFEGLPAAVQKQLWQDWLAGVAVERAAHPFTGQVAPWRSGFGAAAQAGGGSTSNESTSSKSLAEVWGVELHGAPRMVLSGGKDSASYLLTSRAVIRFPTPGAAPAWLSKPGGTIEQALTTDMDGDGALDLVVSVYPDYGDEAADSMFRIDGATGAISAGPLTAAMDVDTWTLADVDGDQKQDVLGITSDDAVVGYKLDGTRVFRTAMPTLPPAQNPLPAGPMVYLSYRPAGSTAFADVNGDGSLDALAVSTYQARGSGSVSSAAYASLGQTLMRVSAYNAKGGAEIWSTVFEVEPRYSYAYFESVGDLDGDKKQEAALAVFGYGGSYVSTPVPDAWMDVDREGFAVLSGANGQLLLRERASRVSVDAPPAPLPNIPIGSLDVFPVGFADLDKDGKDEMIAVAEQAPGRFEVRGLTSSVVPGGAGAVKYRATLDLGVSEEGDVKVILDDTDGDGKRDLQLFVIAADRSTGTLKLESRLLSISSTAVTSKLFPQVLADYFVDGVGRTTYGFFPTDDHFGPLAPDGSRTASSLRLLMPYVQGFGDIDADGVADIILEKSAGLTVLDGRTGKLVRDVNRPLNAYAVFISEEQGEPVAVEQEWIGSNVTAFGLRDDAPRWRIEIDEDADDRLWSIADFDGDGRLDVVIMNGWFWDEDASMRILNPRTGRVLWQSDLKDKYVVRADISARRPGVEVLVSHSGDEGDKEGKLVAIDPSSGKELWTHMLEERSLRGSASGFVLLGDEKEFTILNGDTAAIARTIPVPEGKDLDVGLLDLGGGDIASWTFQELEGGSEKRTFEARVQSLTGPAIDVKLTLEGGAMEMAMPGGGVVFYTRHPSVRGDVGDWDGDGRKDLSVISRGRPAVHSVRDGTLLAQAPLGYQFIASRDADGAGPKELYLGDVSSRLSVMKYDPDAKPIKKPEARILTSPPATPEIAPRHGPANDTPGLSGLAGLVLVAAVVALRRRWA